MKHFFSLTVKTIFLLLFCMQFCAEDKPGPDSSKNTNSKDSLKDSDGADKDSKSGSSKAKKDSKDKKAKSQDLIELRLENTSISSIISHLAMLKGINILPNKDTMDKKISFMCQRKLTIDQAWDAMLTLIQGYGFTVVQNGELYKVVSAKDSPGEPYRVFSSKQGIPIPSTDEIITLIYYPMNMKADQISEIFGAITGEKVKPIADLEVCIITARAAKIKNAMDVIEPLDKEQLKQDMKIVRLNYTKSDDVYQLLTNELINKGTDGQRILIRSIGKKDVSCFSSNVKIFSDPNNQTIILLGQKKQIDKIAEFVEKVLDMQLETEKSKPIKIYEVKYRDATDLANMIRKIIKIAQQGALSPKSMPFKDALIVPTGGGGSGDSSSGGGGSSGGNNLLIFCDNTDYPKLLSLIENLDTLKPQIVLEAMVVDVTDALNRYLEGHLRDTGRNILGADAGWAFANTGDMATITNDWSGIKEAITGAADQTQPDTTLITFGDTTKNGNGVLGNLWGYLYMAISKSNSNLISQPFTVVNNGEETNFISSDTRSLPGEATSKGQTVLKTWQQKPASDIIKVTPRVNAVGMVEMAIEISVADFSQVAAQGVAPDIVDRKVTTKAYMNLGEVLFIGGLSKNTLADTKISVPILGQIPIIGNFFNQKSKQDQKNFLYIFIRPSLIKPRFDDEPDDYTRLKMDYAKLNLKRTDSLVKTKDPVEKYFFRPEYIPLDKVDSYQKNEYFPDVDDFWQRKENPVSSDIARDVYYRSTEAAKKNYAHTATKKPMQGLSSKFKKQRPIVF